LKARVLKANILSNEKYHYIQSSSQTKQIPSSLLDLLFRICLCKSQTSVENFI